LIKGQNPLGHDPLFVEKLIFLVILDWMTPLRHEKGIRSCITVSETETVCVLEPETGIPNSINLLTKENTAMHTYHGLLTLPPRHQSGDDRTTCRIPRVRCVTHPAHLWQSMSMNTDGLRKSNVRVEEEEDDDIVASLEKNTPKQNLSGMRRTHSDQIFASFSESNTSVGSTSTLASSKSHTDFSKVASDMSDQEQILYKNNGKATIDRNFFKSMAKMIKANRSSKADADVVDEKACTHYSDYTVCYTSNSSCGKKSGYVDWIEGHAMRVRIDLKFHLLHERMLACEASNDPNVHEFRR
jgi:hypothetical protein